MVQDRDIVTMEDKEEIACVYRMALLPMPLNDHEGHLSLLETF